MYKIIGVDQKEYGPISADQIRQWISEGRINGQTMAFTDAIGQWRPLSTFPEFASYFSAPPIGAGAPPMGVPPGTKVPNYLVQSILVTLCCCLPLGIVSIVYAAQVNGKLQAGDYDGAVTASNNAKKWCTWAFILGIIANVIVGIIQFAMVGRHMRY